MPRKFGPTLPMIAQRMLRPLFVRLEDQIAAFEQFPMRCPLIPENNVLGTTYRHLIYGAYRITGNTVFIVRIIHGSQLLAPSLLQCGCWSRQLILGGLFGSHHLNRL
jgi:plasmid stabilization system protein ParE